jgi:RND family efflux transporter MFP subunit
MRWLGTWLVSASVVAACNREPTRTAPEPAAAAKPTPLVVSFAKVESRRLPPVLEITGTLEPDEKSEVSAQVAGAVKSVNVDVGTRVKKGDVLVVLDASEAALRLATAKATAQQQRARLGLKGGAGLDVEAVPDVKAAKEARDLAAKEAKRMEELAKTGAVSDSAVDQARSAAERAEANYQSAKNGVEQGWAALQAAEAQAGLSGKNLRDTKVLAPFAGAVVDKRVAVGEFAGVGRVVATVVKDNPLRLKIDVPESEIAGIAVGAHVALRVAAFPNREFSGTVQRLGASINAYSRTLPVEADVPNDDGLLRPGFFVRAQVALEGQDQDVLLVPETAVGTTGTNARVFVREGNRVMEKLVTTGRHVGELVEIRGPIKAGDEVANDKVNELSDAAEVATR